MKSLSSPSFFRQIFWWGDVSKLNPDKDKQTIAVQIINYGMWKHWQWMINRYGKARLKKIIEETPASEFRPAALALARALFNVKKMRYASRSAYIQSQKTLVRT